MLTRILLAEATHLWFNRHEPDSENPLLSVSVLLLSPTLGFFIEPSRAPPLSDLRSILLEYVYFYTVLATSIVLYRISPLHPLANYPGPLICKVTKLWGAWIAITGKSHFYVKELHDQYGPIVRVGPNELSIVDKDAIAPVLGSQGMPRGPLWDGRRFRQADDGKPYDTLIDVRDTQIHAELRKGWNHAFAADPIRDYQELLILRGKQLRSHLRDVIAEQGKETAVVNIAKWNSGIAFDFMGDLAFGGCFELMRHGDVDGIWQGLEDGLVLPCILQHVPWIAPLVRAIPIVSSKMKGLSDFAVRNARRRMAEETKHKDLFHHLYEVDFDPNQSIESQLALAVSNCVLIIVAGADTTATTLTAAICFILSNPDVYARLRKEIDDAFAGVVDADGVPDIEIDKLAGLSYLNAVINESLRLVPAVPSHLQRSPPKGSGGKILGETNIFIGEGTAVNIAPYVLHRSEKYFSPNPEAFIPDRWLSESASTKKSGSNTTTNGEFTAKGDSTTKTGQTTKVKYHTNRDAFIPFSYGPANCAGKPLALVELRYILAILIQSFDMMFEGYSGASVKALKKREEEWMGGLRDRFVFAKPDLKVELKKRW